MMEQTNKLSFKEYYEADMHRYGKLIELGNYTKKLHKAFRKCQHGKSKLVRLYYTYRFMKLREKHGLEISYRAKIGKGLYLGHCYNITINPDAVIGENCNIHKGVLIGQENRGARKGVPTIGNKVWIGANAVVVGKINIGDDVLIAANSFVNKDVPSHSIVFGNPCIIKPMENATEGYINRTV